MILGLLLHAFYSTVTAYLLAHFTGGLKPWVAIVALIIGGIAGARHARLLLKKYPEWRLGAFSKGQSGLIEVAIFSFVLYAAWRHFTWMLFPFEHRWATLSANNLGDLPMHVNFIRALAGGIDFPPRNPIFASELMRYPYGADLYNALWETLGVGLQAHIFAVGLFATLASLILLRAFAGWWGMGAFFLNGGLAGWQILNGTRVLDFQKDVAWKNLFLSVFITQRGILFALPIGILLLILMRGHFSGKKTLDRKELTIAGLLWGFLPLFHVHAFAIVSLLIGAMVFENWSVERSSAFRRLLRLRSLWIAFVPASYLILHSTDFLRAASVTHWNWAWTKTEGASLAEYLATNFGPWMLVPLAIAALLAFASPPEKRRSPEARSLASASPPEKRRSPEARSLAFLRESISSDERRRLWIEFSVYTGLWLLFFNLMLAPWSWDNIKILIWPYLGYARLLYVIAEPRLGRIFGSFEKPVVASVLFFSGIVVVLSTLQMPTLRAVAIYPFVDLARTEGALKDVPKSAVFASVPSYNHPLTYFGRLRVAGYEGHLWSHGINGKETFVKLNQLMKNEREVVQLAREMGITHIFWGPEERRTYGIQEPPWAGLLRNVSRVPDYAIYEVK